VGSKGNQPPLANVRVMDDEKVVMVVVELNP
jgi:hypothetical protein